MRAIALLLLPLAVGCSTPQQRAQQVVNDYGPLCSSMGARQGSPEWQQCIMAFYQQAEADRSQRDAALSATGAAILNANRPAPRTTTTCRWVGPNWVCS